MDLPRNRTKIVATIGPASSSPEVMEAMFAAAQDTQRFDEAQRARAKERGLEFYGILARIQEPKGGWGYYEGPTVSQRPTWSTSFATANVVPALVATNTMAFTAYAGLRRRVIAIVGTIPIVLPWVLEKAGVVPPSYRFDGGDSFTVIGRATSFSAPMTEVTLLLTSLMLAFVTPVIMGRVRDTLRERERRVFMHSWLLRRVA